MWEICYILIAYENISEHTPDRKAWLIVMALLEKWREVAYNEELGTEKLKQLWNAYFQEEKEIYMQLLKNPDEEVRVRSKSCPTNTMCR